MAGDTNSPLLRLPAELRNPIYDLVLIESQAVKIAHGSRSSAKVPALLQTCQQLRNEALKWYYSNSIFLFDRGRYVVSPARLLVQWLQGIGPTARQELHEIRVDLGWRSGEGMATVMTALENHLKTAGCGLQTDVLHLKLKGSWCNLSTLVDDPGCHREK